MNCRLLLTPLALTIILPLIAVAQPAPTTLDVETLCIQGNSAVDKGDYDAALTHYSQAIRLDPKSAKAYFDRAVAFRHKRDYDKSITDNSEAIRIDPTMASALINRGRDYQEKGEYSRAIADFSNAIRLNPKLADAYFGRAFAYISMGEDEKGIADCGEAIGLDPKLAKAYHLRGFAYLRLGDKSKAEADTLQAKGLGYRDSDPAAGGRGSVDPADDIFIRDIEKLVQVSAEEKALMVGIVKTCYKRMQDFCTTNQQELRALNESVEAAERGKDRKAISEAERRVDEATAPLSLMSANMESALEDVLAPSKRERLRQIRFAKSIAGLTDPVRLGDDQMKRFRESFRELPSAGNYGAFNTKLPLAVLKVLTNEQKTWIRTYRVRRIVTAKVGKVRLTGEQTEKVGTIIESLFRNLAFESDWPKFEGMRRELYEKVNAVLTPDQQKDLNANRSTGSSLQMIPIPDPNTP